MSIVEKLHASSVKTETGCWRWNGACNSGGYGHVTYEGKLVDVHRLSLHLFKNFDLTSGLQALHNKECPNKDCWNPDHLHEGDQMDNMIEKVSRITHCPHGHPLDGLRGDGKRYCKACARLRMRKKVGAKL